MGYNKGMKKGRRKLGFTIIEVALVLAITGAIFAMVMSNTAVRVASRRYFDAVNDIAENLRNAYSATINVENYRRNTEDSSWFCSVTSAYEGSSSTLNPDSSTTDPKTNTDNLPGRSRCAVYGQVITFGENSEDPDPAKRSNVYRYDIIGIAKTDNIEPGDGKQGISYTFDGKAETSDDILETLKGGDNGVAANIVTIRQQGNNIYNCTASPAGTYSMYSPQWEARIENRSSRDVYRGAIMIARSPLSGTIHTYFYNAGGSGNYDTINETTDSTSYNAGGISKRSYRDNSATDGMFLVQKWLSAEGTKSCNSFNKADGLFINKAIREGKMVKDGNLDICVGSEDLFAVGNKRRAIRIHGDGSTESAVEVLTEKDSLHVCAEI